MIEKYFLKILNYKELFIKKWLTEDSILINLIIKLVMEVSFLIIFGATLFLIFGSIFLLLSKVFRKDKYGGRNILAYAIPLYIILIPITMLGDYIKYDSIKSLWYYLAIISGIYMILFIAFYFTIRDSKIKKSKKK